MELERPHYYAHCQGRLSTYILIFNIFSAKICRYLSVKNKYDLFYSEFEGACKWDPFLGAT